MSALHDERFEKYETENLLERYITQAPTVTLADTGLTVHDIFVNNTGVEGVVVCENRQPVGLVMRTMFYQKYGTLYGHSLYSNRSIKLMMDDSFLSADVSDTISKISVQAMSREQSKLYDYIIVYKNRAYCGVISIRYFLMELSKRNDAQISVLITQQNKLISAHEQEVRLRQDLEYQTTSIKNLLDHADQGFLSFEKDMKIKNEYSYKCIDIFNASLAGRSFLDLVKTFFDDERQTVFSMVFDNYFKSGSSVSDQVYLMLLPTDCVIAERNIHFDYRRIDFNGNKAVMVILNDVTEKLRLEQSLIDDRNKQRLLIKAFGYQAMMKQTISEFREIINGGYNALFTESKTLSDSLSILFRAIHTFKGDFAQYGFMSASAHLHTVEDALQKIIDCGGDWIQIQDLMSSIDPEKILEDDLNIIHDVLGKNYFNQSALISMTKEKLTAIKERISSGTISIDKETILRLLSNLEYKNVKTYLNQYSDYLEYLSGRVMKNKPVYVVEGDDIEVDSDVYADFFKNLVHIYRNIMDHAIESDEERLEAGKPENGLVVCSIARLNDKLFTISISDDGRGIDLDKLKTKAVENKVYTTQEIEKMAPDELPNLIYADRLSTKDFSDTLSGRGMGMAAVRESCIKLGGKVDVSTTPLQGTTFLFTLPYIE